MTNIGNVANNKCKLQNYSVLPDETKLIINNLPVEIFCHVFSYLSDTDLQNTVSVNKSWNEVTIESGKRNKLTIIKNFGNFLGSNIQDKSYGDLNKKITSIVVSSKIFECTNLYQLKHSFVSSTKSFKNLLNNLKEIDFHILNELVLMEKPQILFEYIINVGIIYKKLEFANSINSQIDKDNALVDISKTLIQIENFDKAVDVAKPIISVYWKGSALQAISEALIKIENFQKALEVASLIPDGIFKLLTLQAIIYALIKVENFQRAIEVANTIDNENIRLRLLLEISKAKQDVNMPQVEIEENDFLMS